MPTAKTIRQAIFKARLNESNIWTFIDGVPCLDRNGYVAFKVKLAVGVGPNAFSITFGRLASQSMLTHSVKRSMS